MLRRLFLWLYAALYDLFNGPGERAGLREQRHDLLTQAAGATIEIGAGTGLNLPVTSPGQGRSAAPARGLSSVRAVVRLRTAGGHCRACCRLRVTTVRTAPDRGPGPASAGQCISPAGRRAAGKPRLVVAALPE